MGGIVGVGCRAVTCMCVCAQGVWPSWPAEHNLIQWVCHKGVCLQNGRAFLAWRLQVCRHRLPTVYSVQSGWRVPFLR
jgi:hypothetical protein